MNYVIELLAIALFAVGCRCQTDPNAHYVENTDPCTSQCKYYGEVCLIQTFAPTGPGYNCNEGYCRLNEGSKCVPIPKKSDCSDSTDPNAHYVNNTDPCASQCEYYGEVCPILKFAPTGPGYDCDRGYCRLNGERKCVPRNAHYVESTDACQSLCKYDSGCPIRPIRTPPAGFNCDGGYCRRTPKSQCTRSICYKR